MLFESDDGQAHSVDSEALSEMFKLFADGIQCVMLNACYSEVQARAIARHIPYVIGMSQAVGDAAAREFAVAFYDALGAGRDVAFAFEAGRSALRLAGSADARI